MGHTSRMHGPQRRAAIIKAALPLFAKNGFAATHTKELAAAAGVSEALIYKHFPDKEALYEAIKESAGQGDQRSIDLLQTLPHGVETLVLSVYAIMRRFSLGHGGEPLDWETRVRLFLGSCLEDGSFMRYMSQNYFQKVIDLLLPSMAKAAEAGDLVEGAASPLNRLHFTHHLALMIGCVQLPEIPGVDYGVPRPELLRQSCWYALRGLGLKDEAITKHLVIDALEKKYQEALG